MTSSAKQFVDKEQILRHAKDLFPQKSIQHLIQSFRPAICPFHRLIPWVPHGSQILDIGCGSGLFIGLLALQGRVGKAFGFDANPKAISLAKDMQRRLSPALYKRLDFECRDATMEWPEAKFDVVSLVDVLHHVKPNLQKHLIVKAYERLLPGGFLIYKDMSSEHALSALFNRLHDLVVSRNWIYYVDIETMQNWFFELGATLVTIGAESMHLYAHEWLVYRRNPI